VPPGDAKSGGSPDGTDFAAGRARLAINFGTVSPRCRWFNGRGPRMVITGRPATDGASRPAFRGKGGALFLFHAAAGRGNWSDWPGLFLKIGCGSRLEIDATVEVQSVVRLFLGKAPVMLLRRADGAPAKRHAHRNRVITTRRWRDSGATVKRRPCASRRLRSDREMAWRSC